MARHAFRVGLREETPLPFALANAGVTQELDPGDILEVQDMAAAIARAEKLVARSSQTLIPAPAPSSSRDMRDMFESLGRRPTDDTAGPATPAPVGLLTPVPPSHISPVASVAPVAPVAPLAPRYLTMPSALPAVEEDAFYQPAGRMRSLADVTLDGYRPEPTLLVRAASRRKRFSWLFVAALLPLLVLAAIAIFANADTASSSPIAAAPRAASVAERTRTPITTISAASKSAAVAESSTIPTPSTLAAKPTSGTPVFDVNSLPSAGIRTKR